ncbi:MAG: hypothetical protein ACXWIU_01035 [Limisphaerales bacterium]
MLTNISLPAGPIDWTHIQPVSIPVSARVFAQPSAIYVESRSYQTAQVKGMNFAIVGHYPEADSQIMDVQMAR